MDVIPSMWGRCDNMTKKKIVPLALILIGIAFLLGAIISWLDNLTATEPVGLGKWIFDIFVALIGAGSGIKGWLDWNKKETQSQVTNISAKEFSPLHQLPQPPADFTGREELIEQLLGDFTSHKGATISGLTGMGGTWHHQFLHYAAGDGHVLPAQSHWRTGVSLDPRLEYPRLFRYHPARTVLRHRFVPADHDDPLRRDLPLHRLPDRLLVGHAPTGEESGSTPDPGTVQASA